MSEWQPIENAPKDGTPLFLWLKEKADRHYEVGGLCDNLAIGFWIHGGWHSIECEDCGTMGGEYTGWMSDWSPISLRDSPTHWMPLPEPPK